MMNTIQTALSGLIASTKKVGSTAQNIANLNTAGSLEDANNPPFNATTTVQRSVTGPEGEGQGVRADVVPKNTPFVPSFDPDSPFANEDGVIGVPNVNLAEEAVNLTLAETTYKANVKVIQTVDELQEELLRAFDSEE